MKLFPLQAIGSQGINTDLPPWTLPLEYITSGNNFRLLADSIENVPADINWGTPVSGFNGGHTRFAGVSSGEFWLVAGRIEVWVWNGAIFSDISSTNGYAAIGIDQELNWNSCMLGDIPIINNKQVYPEYWSPQDINQVLQPLQFDAANTWQDLGYQFAVIRSHKDFLFALDLFENGVEFPNSYRWSHPADINGLPFTWDENDLSSLASKEQLAGDTGRIIDGLSLRDAFCIYSERGIDILDFTGGDFVFRRRRLSSTIGVLSVNNIVEIKGTHFFIGDGDIYANDGNSIKSIGHDNIRRRLNQNGSGDFYDRAFVVENVLAKEVWFCVPENGSVYPNTAYIFNYIDQTWGIQKLPDNMAHASYGRKSVPPVTWANVTDTWASSTSTWSGSGTPPLSDRIIAVDNSDSSLIDIDPVGTTIGNTVSFVERTNMPLEGVVGVVTITRAYPRITGAPVNIKIGAHEYPGSNITWSNVVTYDPAVDRKIDLRITGKLIAWRVDSIGSGLFNMSGLDLEYADAGKR